MQNLAAKTSLPKLIEKFTRTNVRNELYAKRKVLASKNLLEDPVLKMFLVGKKTYISESLVTAILSFVYLLT